jgi:hypothetical protein
MENKIENKINNAKIHHEMKKQAEIINTQQNLGGEYLLNNENINTGNIILTQGQSTITPNMQTFQQGSNTILQENIVQEGSSHHHSNLTDTKVFTSSVPITKQIPVVEYVTETKTIPIQKEVEVMRNVPVQREVQYTENVGVKTMVPVTKMEERIKTVPVTKNVQYIENETVTSQVPVTRIEERVRTVPVTKTHQIIEQVPVKTMVDVTENVEVMKSVPVTRTKQVVENVSVTSTVPVTENVQVTKSFPVTRQVEVVQHVPITMSQNLITDNFAQLGLNQQNLIQGTSSHLHSAGLNTTHQTLIEGQQGYVSGMQTTGIPTTMPLQGTTYIEGQHHLYKDSHLHQAGLTTTTPILNQANIITTGTAPLISSVPVIGGITTTTSQYRGIPGCKICHGVGYRKSKKHAHMKACKPCVKATGQCGVCGNSGIRNDDHKNCTCYYAK